MHIYIFSSVTLVFVSEAPHEKDTFLIESVLVTDSTPVANLVQNCIFYEHIRFMCAYTNKQLAFFL